MSKGYLIEVVVAGAVALLLVTEVVADFPEQERKQTVVSEQGTPNGEHQHNDNPMRFALEGNEQALVEWRQHNDNLLRLVLEGDEQAFTEWELLRVKLGQLAGTRDKHGLEEWRRLRANLAQLDRDGNKKGRTELARWVMGLNRQQHIAVSTRPSATPSRKPTNESNVSLPSPRNSFAGGNSSRPQFRSSATADFYNISPYGGRSRITGQTEIPNPFGGRPIRSDFRIDTDVRWNNGRLEGTSTLVID